MNPKNPFLTKGYAGKEYFCDREKETGRFIAAVENDRDITLIAPRRYGKTGLISNALAALPNEYAAVYVDVYSTTNLSEFVKVLASAVVGALDTRVEKALANALNFFKSCRPTITPQEFGMPKFSFDVTPSTAELSLKEVFDYIAKRDRRIVIAIDEFQQVLEYPEKGTEALIRSYTQFVPWVRFVYSGSRQHLMREMFLSPKHPFYNSTEILSLGVIPEAAYAGFARSFFNRESKPFEDEAFSYLYRRFGGVTWYLQMVLNKLWEFGGLGSPEEVELAVEDIVLSRAQEYHDLLVSQTEAERALLKAVAAEGRVASPQSGEFLSRYSLSAASTVASAMKDLLSRDLIYRGEDGYFVYERFFGEWLRKGI